MEIGYKFEKLIESYIGIPNFVTYAEYWGVLRERVSLLFTVCLIEYDKHSSGVTEKKLSYFMEELFESHNVEKTSEECFNFLYNLKFKE